MTRPELEVIVSEELAARPIFAPANVNSYLTMIYRDLVAFPAAEVRRAVRDFYRSHQVNRWPQAEEIRSEIPHSVAEKVAHVQRRADPDCPACDGTGWRPAKMANGDDAVKMCGCRGIA